MDTTVTQHQNHSATPSEASRESLSALMDGQLSGADRGRVFDAVGADPSLRAVWRDYHAIGEALRGGASVASPASDAFVRGVMASIVTTGQSVVQPDAINSIAIERDLIWASGQFHSKNAASNDSSFRWKLVAGVASVAAVASIGWSLVSTAPIAQPQLASTSAPAVREGAVVLTGSGQGVMIRDPRLDELLEAHRQMGSPSAMTMPAGGVRNASLQGSAR